MVICTGRLICQGHFRKGKLFRYFVHNCGKEMAHLPTQIIHCSSSTETNLSTKYRDHEEKNDVNCFLNNHSLP